MTTVVTLREDQGNVLVEARLESDAGWYVYRLKALGDRYQVAFESKLKAVRNVISSQ